jgi:hypothetical protein
LHLPAADDQLADLRIAEEHGELAVTLLDQPSRTQGYLREDTDDALCIESEIDIRADDPAVDVQVATLGRDP